MPDRDDLDLGTLGDFAIAVAPMAQLDPIGPTRDTTTANGLYCSTCGEQRRVRIGKLFWEPPGRSDTDAADFTLPRATPALFGLRCLQCGTVYHALVSNGPAGPELAIHSPVRGGLSTPETPSNVSYYLDQAHRSESVGATSAATAMYRSALEVLLYQQGYTDGMLKRKIDDLLADDDPPKWRDRIDSEYLEALKELGNAAIHPNDGDEKRQAALDRKLLAELRAVFVELLDEVYERPAREQARKAALDQARNAF